MRPSCSSSFSFKQDELVLHPDMDFCETRPEPFLASIEMTPSLNQVFAHVPSICSAKFQAYSTSDARQSVLGSLHMELAELPDVQHMSLENLDQLTEPIAKYYSSISPATFAALQSYLPTRAAFLLSSSSIRMSLLTFSVSFTSFCRHWQRYFTKPQRFVRATSRRFINIVDSLTPKYDSTDSPFLYSTDTEFRALILLACETIRHAEPKPSNYTVSNAPTLPQRVYPNISAPTYESTST